MRCGTHAERVSPYVAESLDMLADDMGWLAQQLEQSAETTLQQLDLAAAIPDALRQQRQRTNWRRARGGRGCVPTVRTGQGTLLQFMQHIRELMNIAIYRQTANRRPDGVNHLHQAKGLEWLVVFVPGVNQGYAVYRYDHI